LLNDKNATMKGISFPSGNIATPISHPLEKEKTDKDKEKKPQSLDQVKDEHDKLKNSTLTKVEDPKPKQAPQSLVQATTLASSELESTNSEEK